MEQCEIILGLASDKYQYIKKNSLQPIRFLSWEEVQDYLLPSYSKKAYYECIRNHAMSYEVAEMYLKQLQQIYFCSPIASPKFQFLKDLQQELMQQGVYQPPGPFLKIFRNQNLIVSTNGAFSREEQQLLDQLSLVATIKEQPLQFEQNTPKVYHFSTVEEEVLFVAIQIIELLKQDIPGEQIKLISLPENYRATVKRIFQWFQIPLSLKSNKKIINTALGSTYLNQLFEGRTREELEDFYKERYALMTPAEQDIYQQMIAIMNTYVDCPLDEVTLSCLEKEFSQMKVSDEILEGAITETETDFTQYNFLLGFHQGNYPKVWKNEDYFSDTEKEQLGLSTSNEKNRLEKNRFYQLLFRSSNLVITYADQSPFETFYPSSLLQDWNLSPSKVELQTKYQYSNLYNEYMLAKQKDEFRKYNMIDKDYPLLAHHYPNHLYRSYNNQFTGVMPRDLYSFWNYKLMLSFSHLDHFYRCGFRYYMNHVLKLAPVQENFSLLLGNLFHELLAQAFQPEFSLDQEWTKKINQHSWTKKELFFLEERKKDLQLIIEVIQKQDQYSELKNALYEEKVYLNYTKEIPVTFMGIMDKIKYKEENQHTLLAIIDYKTGSPELNLNHTIHGLDMQLPIYLFLADYIAKFSKVEVVGIYLQKLLPSIIGYDPKKTYLEQKKDVYRLEGYSSDQEEDLRKFDCTYENSEVIKGMKLTKNGFYSYAKTISPEKKERLKKLVGEKIEEAMNDILQGKFNINPKRLEDELVGCKYCSFADLCYKREENIIDLASYRNLEFLGGEEQ